MGFVVSVIQQAKELGFTHIETMIGRVSIDSWADQPGLELFLDAKYKHIHGPMGFGYLVNESHDVIQQAKNLGFTHIQTIGGLVPIDSWVCRSHFGLELFLNTKKKYIHGPMAFGYLISIKK